MRPPFKFQFFFHPKVQVKGKVRFIFKNIFFLFFVINNYVKYGCVFLILPLTSILIIFNFFNNTEKAFEKLQKVCV